MEADRSDAEMLEVFNGIIASTEFDDLRTLPVARRVMSPCASVATFRRMPLKTPVLLQVRIDLDGASPPIWRRLEIRSDLTLDHVHAALQAAFGWRDSHLHMFALGGRVDDSRAEKFLCPFDVQDGEPGTPAVSVRLDETLQRPGERLHYVYDYGDKWELTIRVEEVRDLKENSPNAICTGGRRGAPPEDSGGHRDAAHLAELLADPVAFDRATVNRKLAAADPVLRAALVLEKLPRKLLESLPKRLLEMLEVALTVDGIDVAERLGWMAGAGGTGGTRGASGEQIDVEHAVLPFTRFLRIVGDGISLTHDGFLPSSTVQTVATFLPTMADWIDEVVHEPSTHPVWSFRLATESLGLTRRQRGALLLTVAGRGGAGDPVVLWRHLAARIANPPKRGPAVIQLFRRDAILLALFYVASGRNIPLNDVVRVLQECGWRAPRRDLMRILMHSLDAARAVFDLIGPAAITADRFVTFGREAEALARAALVAEVEAEGRE